MEILGQQLISAPRQKVWDALNDPLILKQCLPGCESVEQLSPEEFRVVIKTAIGPLKAHFQGSLKISEAKVPESCVMHFEGQGGAIGFGKGTASVTLKEATDGTDLTYEAKAQIGGKLAQVGSRLIDSVAKKMADDFFKAFQIAVGPKPSEQDTAISESKKNITTSNADAASIQQQNLPHPTERMVPAWWLFPAVVLGAAIMLAGSRWVH